MVGFSPRALPAPAHETHRYYIQDRPANCRDSRWVYHSRIGYHHDCYTRAGNHIYSNRTHSAWPGICLGPCVAPSFTEIDQLCQCEIPQRACRGASSAVHGILRGSPAKEKEPKKPGSIFDWWADPTWNGLRLPRLTASRGVVPSGRSGLFLTSGLKDNRGTVILPWPALPFMRGAVSLRPQPFSRWVRSAGYQDPAGSHSASL